jgi:hypothetical protein
VPNQEKKKVSVTKYTVVIKGRGIIYDGDSFSEADSAFELFMSQSMESDNIMATLFQDSDIVRQWYRHFEL